GDPDAAPLADRVMHEPLVLAKDLAFLVDDLAGRRHVRPMLGDEVGVGAIADEANLLALGLVRDRQAIGAGKATRLGLRQVAKRELDEIHLLLRQRMEHIALVLAVVERAIEAMRNPLPGIAAFDPRIVAGREAIRAEQLRPLDEMPELHMPVAFKA